MITFSAFADEIGDDLDLQMDVCQANGVKCIDVRGIDGKNVSKMTIPEVQQYKSRMDDRGFTCPCIGSPIGKIKMDDDFNAHMELLKHCFEVAEGFGTKQIRVFSFYASADSKIEDQTDEVMDRMRQMVAAAESAGMILLHENEHNIYGATCQGVKDLFATIKSDSFKSIFDPANFVTDNIAPYEEAWKAGLADLTDYFHIKDKVRGQETCVPAGEGDGQMAELFADLRNRNWSGYMTLEPHMAVAGQFRGFTGPELFAKAVDGLKKLCKETGLSHN